MKTSLTPLLIAFAGMVSLASSRAVAQGVFQQQPIGPQAEQFESAMPQNGSPIVPYSQDENMLPEEAPTPSPEGDMPDDGFLIDNGLWDGAPVGPCCANCGGGSGCPPDWYSEQGVRILGRSRPRPLNIGSIYDGATLTTVLDSRSAVPDVSLAYATTLGHYFARDRLNRDNFVEFSFWGLNEWKDKAVRLGDGNLYSQFAVSGFFLDGFDAANLHSIYYASYNNNYELNGRIVPRGRPDRLVLHPNGKWRRECQPGIYLSYLYGLRFFQENETFHFHGESVSGGVTSTGDYDIVTHNNLLGFQIGADLEFRKCRWKWGIRAKLGPYINFSDQQSTIDSGPALAPTLSRRLALAKHEASLIGETGFYATYKFRPNLMGRVGYDFMWVTGMVLAPEQLQFAPTFVNQVNTNGTIFYEGVSLSLEWLW